MDHLNGTWIGIIAYFAFLLYKPHHTIAISILALALIGAMYLLFR